MLLTTTLEALERAGLTVSYSGGRLMISPADKITAELDVAICRHREEIVAAINSRYRFESDDPTWPRLNWCRRYRHKYGWRDTSGVVHCLTCCRPSLSSPLSRILASVGGDITERDPFAALSGDGDLLESQRMAIINQLAMHHKEGP